MAFALLLRARHPLVPAIRRGQLTTRQASLHVTDRTVARPRTGALDAGLRPRPFPDDTASLLPGSLTTTRTGLPPASDDELTSQLSTSHSINHQSLLDTQEPADDLSARPQPHPPRQPPPPGQDNPRSTSGRDGDVRGQIRRLRAEGGTYRSIAAAAGLAPATVHDIASGRRTPTPATSKSITAVTSASLRRVRVDAAAPGCGCGPCTSWATAPPAWPAPSASARCPSAQSSAVTPHRRHQPP